MQTCSLFGDQCFRRNMVFTVAQLRLDDFYDDFYSRVWLPSRSKVEALAGWPIRTFGRPFPEIDIYYNRAAQIQTATRELRCCLTAFEECQ